MKKNKNEYDFDLATIDDFLVEIPKGSVDMRDDRTKEKWTAEIQPFLLSQYPVTQEFYFSAMQVNPSTFSGEKFPVETVSWKDAVVFCNKLSALLGFSPCYVISAEKEEIVFHATANGFRLPTEAEWQYACHAGTDEIRYGELDDIAWYKENALGQPHEVGQKLPNPWGVYDMLGNVWEWCSDIYDETVYGSYRIFRGGGWADDARGVMATNRRRSHPVAFKIDDLGFRIGRNLIT